MGVENTSPKAVREFLLDPSEIGLCFPDMQSSSLDVLGPDSFKAKVKSASQLLGEPWISNFMQQIKSAVFVIVGAYSAGRLRPGSETTD